MELFMGIFTPNNEFLKKFSRSNIAIICEFDHVFALIGHYFKYLLLNYYICRCNFMGPSFVIKLIFIVLILTL